MKWLTRLKSLESGQVVSLQNRQKEEACAFVGFVGAQPAIFQETVLKSDQFTKRVSLFVDSGVGKGEATTIAAQLERRDCELDERRLCLECAHLLGTVSKPRCSQYQKIGPIFDSAIPIEIVTLLQRCVGFVAR